MLVGSAYSTYQTVPALLYETVFPPLKLLISLPSWCKIYIFELGPEYDTPGILIKQVFRRPFIKLVSVLTTCVLNTPGFIRPWNIHLAVDNVVYGQKAGSPSPFTHPVQTDMSCHHALLQSICRSTSEGDLNPRNVGLLKHPKVYLCFYL